MEKFNRAVRRHHVKRLKRKRQFYWFGTRTLADSLRWQGDSYIGVSGVMRLSPKALGMVVQSPQSCSCPSCGNARRYEGRTRSELGFLQLIKSEIA